MPDSHGAAAVPAGVLLDALAAQVQLRAGQGDNMEGIHHGGGLGKLLSRGGLVAAESVHGHHLNPVTEGRRLPGQPGLQCCRRAPRDQVEQSCPAGAVEHRGQVDDHGDEPIPIAAAAGV